MSVTRSCHVEPEAGNPSAHHNISVEMRGKINGYDTRGKTIGVAYPPFLFLQTRELSVRSGRGRISERWADNDKREIREDKRLEVLKFEVEENTLGFRGAGINRRLWGGGQADLILEGVRDEV